MAVTTAASLRGEMKKMPSGSRSTHASLPAFTVLHDDLRQLVGHRAPTAGWTTAFRRLKILADTLHGFAIGSSADLDGANFTMVLTMPSTSRSTPASF